MSRFAGSTDSSRRGSAVSMPGLRESWGDCLERVRGQLRDRLAPAVEVALVLLESLPLATADFAAARARLENARRYASGGEWGAADFELRLLKGLASGAT